MTSDSLVQTQSSVRSAATVDDLDRTVDWRRLVWAGHGVALLALCAMVFGAILQAVSTVVSGRLAANPSWSTVVDSGGMSDRQRDRRHRGAHRMGRDG